LSLDRPVPAWRLRLTRKRRFALEARGETSRRRDGRSDGSVARVRPERGFDVVDPAAIPDR
jgi:hypothetical protein